MGVLTKLEREGLEEVFLSIHTKNEKYQKFKNLSALIMKQKIGFSGSNPFKGANFGLNELKLSYIITYLLKKKK